MQPSHRFHSSNKCGLWTSLAEFLLSAVLLPLCLSPLHLYFYLPLFHFFFYSAFFYFSVIKAVTATATVTSNACLLIKLSVLQSVHLCPFSPHFFSLLLSSHCQILPSSSLLFLLLSSLSSSYLLFFFCDGSVSQLVSW